MRTRDPWMFHYMIGIWVFKKEEGTMHVDLVTGMQ